MSRHRTKKPDRERPGVGGSTAPGDAVTLARVLGGHGDVILRVGWSPDGKTIATTSVDRTIRLWDAATPGAPRILSGHREGVNEVAWGRPDDGWLVSCSYDRTLRVWDLPSGLTVRELTGHEDDVSSVSVSPDGTLLASASADRTVAIWRTDTWDRVATLLTHTSAVYRVAWSPDGRHLATCSKDGHVQIHAATQPFARLDRIRIGANRSRPSSVAWSRSGRMLCVTSFDGSVYVWPWPHADDGIARPSDLAPAVLTLHTGTVRSGTFSADERLLATSSNDGSVVLWRTDRWESAARIDEPTAEYWPQGIAFHPEEPVLATFGERDRVVRLWRVDVDRLLGVGRAAPGRIYRNAKVVLLGDTGVGKSGLRLVLTGEPFVATESTHGRRVWTLAAEEREVDGRLETRETLLWDMAGQPEYRLLHQLHLKEIAVALLVFDARQATGDPLAPVRHWERAVRLAQERQGTAAVPLRRLLVVARTDVAGTPLSRERVAAVVREWGFDGFFETSAKEGWGIDALGRAIREAIPWAQLPEVHSSDLLVRIREFLLSEKAAGRLLATGDELWRAFAQANADASREEKAREAFDASLSRLENRDVLRRLSFGGYVLLQPELLDGYASAIIRAAAAGAATASGSISEEDALLGRFQMPQSERVPDAGTERLLLLATVEELLQHQLALREPAQDGVHLVFPSQSRREAPELDEPKGLTASIAFEGPVQNVYATLVVRLAHSGEFGVRRDGVYRNAALFEAGAGGACGVGLREFGDGRGEVRLFFGTDAAGRRASAETEYRFEAFVLTHLTRRALSGTVRVTRQYRCPACDTAVPTAWVDLLRAQGKTEMACPGDGTRIPLAEPLQRVDDLRRELDRMDSAADRRRDVAVSDVVMIGKEAVGEHDVLLCYNHGDTDAVSAIDVQLRQRRIRPWIDRRDLPPGTPWLTAIERVISSVRTAAVFIGPAGPGRVQGMEISLLLQMFASRGMRVIPVLLPGSPAEPFQFSRYLEIFHRVDFRQRDPEPLGQLIWGITGTRPDAN